MQAAVGLSARLSQAAWGSPSHPNSGSSLRATRSPLVVSCTSSRIFRRWWGIPTRAAASLEAAPAAPAPTTATGTAPRKASVPAGGAQPASPHSAHECLDFATQPLAVSLTLEEYRQSLMGSASDRQAQQQAYDPSASAAGSGSAFVQSHSSLSSLDLEAMRLCTDCRYPCYLSGMPTCEAGAYLRMWDADSYLKPRGFDAGASLRLAGVADIAAVSSGGRANGRWKPDNQDAFLVQPTTKITPAAAAAQAAAAGESGPVQTAAAAAGQGAAIGVFDGHGRLGNAAATIVRRAMSERLAAQQDDVASSGSGDASAGSAVFLLDGCFAAAEAALAESGRDFSKSGCTAVLALLSQDSVSVAWAGDSRAVLGVCDTSGALLASSPLSSSGSSSGSLSSYDPSFSAAAAGPVCAAVPLTEDHKPDRPAELARISAAGGRVTRLATDRQGKPAGPFRVFTATTWSPGLALSRAFGDTLAGSVGVTCKPEVTVLPLPPAPTAASHASLATAGGGISNGSASTYCSSSSDSEAAAPDQAAATAAAGNATGSSSRGRHVRHVLIVASDGLWEWISNAAAVGIAASAASAEDAAHALLEAAQKQWAVRYRGRNCDDCTVVVAFLHR